MRIGMGGGAASSMAAGANAPALDFDSVQRGNPEIQRRAQEVINHCWALGEDNPILAIHDVGAGGLSNAFPELVDGAGLGARFDLRRVPLEESGLAPKETLVQREPGALRPGRGPRVAADLFDAMCAARALPVCGRRCRDAPRQPARARGRRPAANAAIDMPMDVLLGKPPKMLRDVHARRARPRRELDLTDVDARDGRVRCAAPPDGRQQAVPGHDRRPHGRGPEQPRPDGRAVAGAGGRLRGDAGRLQRLSRRGDEHGRAHAARGARCTGVGPHGGRRGDHQPARGAAANSTRVKLSCNWMAACGEPGEDAALYDTVRAVGDGAVPGAGHRRAGGQGQPVDAHALDATAARPKQVTAPVSLIVTAFATLADVRATLTPQLQPGDTTLVLIDLGPGQEPAWPARCWRRCSARSSASERARPRRPGAAEGAGAPRSTRCARRAACSPTTTAATAACGRRSARWRSPAHLGVSLNVDMLVTEGDGIGDSRAEYGDSKNWATQVGARRHELTLRALFSEELGGVIQVPDGGAQRGDADPARVRPEPSQPLHRQAERARRGGDLARREGACSARRCATLHQAWDEVSWRIAQLRDNPACADAEHAAAGRADDPGLHLALSFDAGVDVAAPFVGKARPQARDPARAGRQQPRRDELRDGPRRLRHLRRAHERPAGRSRAPGSVPGLRRLRRLQLRRHARRGRGLGALGAVQPGAGRAVRGLLPARATPSRSASATAAR